MIYSQLYNEDDFPSTGTNLILIVSFANKKESKAYAALCLIHMYQEQSIKTGILTVRFPDLGKEDVIVPGTLKLSFKIQLNSDNDANRPIVNNLGRLEVKLEGRSIFTLDDSDVFSMLSRFVEKHLKNVQTQFIKAFKLRQSER